MPPITPQNPIPPSPIVNPTDQKTTFDSQTDLLTPTDFRPRQGASLDIARETFDQLITLIESREAEASDRLGAIGQDIPLNPLGTNYSLNISYSPPSLTLDETDPLTGQPTYEIVVGHNFGPGLSVKLKQVDPQPK